MVVEQDCLILKPYEAEELRAEIRGVLKHSYTSRSNITKVESQPLKELREDETRVILTAYKGVVSVAMNKPEYTSKAQVLLEDEKTHQEIKDDPTNRYKKRLINLLKKIKAEGGIMTPYTRCTQQEQLHLNFIGCLRSTREACSSDLQCLARTLLPMKQPRSWPRSLDHW